MPRMPECDKIEAQYVAAVHLMNRTCANARDQQGCTRAFLKDLEVLDKKLTDPKLGCQSAYLAPHFFH
jgi:hypothetical protein